MPKTATHMALRTRTTYSYNIDLNSFVPDSIPTQQVAGYCSASGADTPAKVRSIPLEDAYKSRQPYWNVSMDPYGDAVRQLFESNALIVNTVGYTTRQPSDIVQVDIQQDNADWMSESESQYRDWKTRYKELAGPWFVAQVRHTIEPAAKRYRQNLVLFRNFFTPPA